MSKNKENTYHLIIIGAGPAGLSASIYAQRAGVNTLVLEKFAPGGQILTSDKIENYPAFPNPISTKEFVERMIKQAKNFGMKLKEEEVEKIKIQGEEKIVYTEPGNTYKSYALIIATGASPSSLGVPGEKELIGRGVSYCATCDAPFFKDKKVVVVGGGDTAVKETIYLTKFAQKVYLLHRRDSLRAEKILQEKILNNKKVTILWSTVLDKIYGKEKVEGVLVRNLKNGRIEDITCEGIFIFVGIKPNSDFVKEKIKLDEKGFIITDEMFKTNIPGIFACGDVRKNFVKQVVVACSEGAQAALMASRYLEEKGKI